jgi:hypothetical protein
MKLNTLQPDTERKNCMFSIICGNVQKKKDPKVEEGLLGAGRKEGGHDQSTIYTCMEMSQ